MAYVRADKGKRRATRLAIAAALLLSALVSTGAYAQERGGPPDEALEAKLEKIRQSFPAGDAEQVAAVVEAAQEDGLPARLVADKALEGAAKRVPSDRVSSVLSGLLDRLSRSQSLLGESGDPAAVAAGADALQRGVPPDRVRETGRAAGPEAAVALVVLADLVELGVPVERAVEAVQRALDQGQGGQALLDLPGSVRRLVRTGTPPSHAASAAVQALGRGGPPAGRPGGPPSAGGGRGGGPPSGAPVPPGAGPPGEPPGGKKPSGQGKGGSGGSGVRILSVGSGS